MTETQAPPYRDRRAGLIFFRLVELLIGILCFMFVVLSAIGLFFARNQPGSGVPAPPARQLFASVAVYLLAGSLLVTLGVGSMLARRWARDLSLVVAWLWLIVGLASTAGLVFMLPRIMSAMPADSSGANTFVFTCLAVFVSIFEILIPLAMVLFYRSPHVRATCLARDPHPRWTERAPLPLLGLSLWVAVSAAAMTTMSAYAVLPLGRQIVTGPIAVMTYCAIGILLLYVSWGLFRRSLVAWWIGIAYGVLTAAYCALVFPQLDYNALIKAMGMPTTPGMPDFAGIYRSPWVFGFLAIFWIGYLGYFMFVLRYFRHAER